MEVRAPLFLHYLFLSSFPWSIRSLVFIKVFHPSDHHFRQVLVVVVVSRYHYTPALESFFPGGCQSTFSFLSHLNWWVEILASSIIHIIYYFFLGLITANPLHVDVSFDFFPPFLHLATIDSTIVPILSTLQCVIMIKRNHPFSLIVHLMDYILTIVLSVSCIP